MISLNSRTMNHLAARLAPLVSERLAARPRPADLAGDPEALLNEREAAKVLRLQPSTLTAWRARGHGPQFLRLGAKRRPPVRYRLGDILEFRDRSIVTPSRG